jgi:hypothetical protein
MRTRGGRYGNDGGRGGDTGGFIGGTGGGGEGGENKYRLLFSCTQVYHLHSTFISFSFYLYSNFLSCSLVNARIQKCSVHREAGKASGTEGKK